MKRNYLFIGGSEGMGLALVKLFHEKHHLFVASRSNDQLSGLNVEHIAFDATQDHLSEQNLPDSLDGFVYFPGSINLRPFKMMSSESFQEDMQINFFSMVNSLKDIIGRMKEGSSIVLFSTVAVEKGMPFHTSIASAKGAIEGFAKSLAAEYAPKIRVNVIAPSLVDTSLAEKLLNNDKKKEQMAERHPLKRIGHTGDIAQLASYLLSDKSSWVTGQIFRIDGGMSTLNIH
ncbi:SDR family oxidoreductase [Euzebyella marina]|uniref:SDR family oxidoreductase n=1 Tax=Euzebyella marina TaxID=1761453 RepID=A0A3G2L7S5_9FLAO|nr:SDR family oxidoreductase [Euzebyella marina]AYN68332.1 SDR family oxidoreductase [Euzebyella marina]MAU72882.1 oxidoreductase [Pseudozobellia sp.]MBG50597.1 oxidoreductase [Pseudozobellia sp.]|tara:strand:+ start:1394 stop:2086 length:693 start_codon:yes stop_codon:yes gene_type:complete